MSQKKEPPIKVAPHLTINREKITPVFLGFSIFCAKCFVSHTGLELIFDFG
jgi:hypothetical protein